MKKKILKYLSVVLTVVLVLTTFASCTPKTPDNSGETQNETIVDNIKGLYSACKHCRCSICRHGLVALYNNIAERDIRSRLCLLSILCISIFFYKFFCGVLFIVQQSERIHHVHICRAVRIEYRYIESASECRRKEGSVDKFPLWQPE